MIFSQDTTFAETSIARLDKQEFFKNPVSKQVVPDYYDIVTKPMCWTMIEAKLDRHGYWDTQAFKVNLLASCNFHHTLTRIRTT
jgi:NuA3 HAT complex component NTO1